MNIVFIASSIGFPNGMAGTERVKLLARSLIETGNSVNLLHFKVSEWPPFIHNFESKGNYYGIDFEYTTGTTIRAEKFINRRAIELKGVLAGLKRLRELNKNGQLDIAYFYGGVLSLSPLRIIILEFLKSLKVPVIMDLCERPWSLATSQSFLERHISPFYSVNGAVAISKFLYDWAIREKDISGRLVNLLQVPILINIHEYEDINPPQRSQPTVLYAASAGYDVSFKFVMDAMGHVWNKVPNCELHITGIEPSKITSKYLIEEISGRFNNGNIKLLGYLSRKELHYALASSTVLLCPLFNDVRSQARFPTKIGEYLRARRPLVTNNVGELNHYLKDGVNAMVCDPDDSYIYSKKIVELLKNRKLSDKIGETGWKTAKDFFHYSVYGPSLNSFFAETGSCYYGA